MIKVMKILNFFLSLPLRRIMREGSNKKIAGKNLERMRGGGGRVSALFQLSTKALK